MGPAAIAADVEIFAQLSSASASVKVAAYLLVTGEWDGFSLGIQRRICGCRAGYVAGGFSLRRFWAGYYGRINLGA